MTKLLKHCLSNLYNWRKAIFKINKKSFTITTLLFMSLSLVNCKKDDNKDSSSSSAANVNHIKNLARDEVIKNGDLTGSDAQNILTSAESNTDAMKYRRPQKEVRPAGETPKDVSVSEDQKVESDNNVNSFIAQSQDKLTKDHKVLSVISKYKKDIPAGSQDAAELSNFLSYEDGGKFKVRGAGFFSWISKVKSKVDSTFQMIGSKLHEFFIDMYYDAKGIAKYVKDKLYTVEHAMWAFYQKEKPYFEEAANIMKIFPKGTLSFLGSELIIDVATGGIANFPVQLQTYWQKNKTVIENNFEHLLSYEFLKYATEAGQKLCFSSVDGQEHVNNDKGACATIKYGLEALNSFEKISQRLGFANIKTDLCEVARKDLCKNLNSNGFKFITDENTCLEKSNNAQSLEDYISGLVSKNREIQDLEKSAEEVVKKNAALQNIWNRTRVVYKVACSNLAGATELLTCDNSKRKLCFELEKEKAFDDLHHSYDEVNCSLESVKSIQSKFSTLIDSKSSIKTLFDDAQENCSNK